MEEQKIMKFTLTFVSIIVSLLFITSCNKSCHGCIDSNATNYNEFAEIDNNSCCFNCYDEIDSFIGEYCGNEVDEVVENGYLYENIHIWVLDGELVLPGTPGAVPFFSQTDPVLIMDWNSEVSCY